MIWGDGDNTGGYGLAGATGVVGAIGSALAILIPLYFSKRREGRKDTIDEWKEIAENLGERIDKMQVEHKDKMKKIGKSLARCRKSEVEGRVKVAKLEGEITLLQSTMRRLQIRTGDEPPPTVSAGIVIADTRGVIQVASPALTPILHWLPNELKGKSVEVLMPDRYKDKHREGMKNVLLNSTPPWPEKPILVEAITKEGTEVPVAVALSGWKTEKGDWLITAEVSLRKVDLQTRQVD